MRPLARAHLPTLLWALLTGVSLLVPDPALERCGGLPGWTDSAAHFLLFLGMAFLVVRSLRAAGRPRPLATACALSLAYGLILELAQIGVEGRSFEWLDLAFDGLGALAGVAGASARPYNPEAGKPTSEASR